MESVKNMIDRYTRPEMGAIWSPQVKFSKMMEVEIAVARAQASLGLIPKKAAADISRKSRFSVARIAEIEKETKHDVIAFVKNLTESVGPSGKFIHFGLTSSDVLDTALSLQIREGAKVLEKSFDLLEKSLSAKVKKFAKLLCAGRTHGMLAEPTTLGLKLAGFLAEFRRSRARVERALSQLYICKLSGAVGTYASLGPQVELKVAKALKLNPETIATQVVPRDRHAELFTAFALMAGFFERLGIELRHLQRSEVGEVEEGFTPGQKGSSAMPHKKNPISAENLTGISRLLRSYALASLENIALWHERDISHSSVERVIFPDAFILIDYATIRMASLIDSLRENDRRIRENLDRSGGQIFSSQALLHLVQKGLSRDEAYAHIQRICFALGRNEHLKARLKSDKAVGQYFSSKELDCIFSGERVVSNASRLIKRELKSMTRAERFRGRKQK
jgi:adenylosuccinate lyase